MPFDFSHFITKRTVSRISYLSTLILSTSMISANALANSCTKADIDYYLQRGFTHDQVIRLCDGSPSNAQTQQQQNTATALPYSSTYATTQSAVANAGNTAANRANLNTNEDRVFFETVLLAKTASLTPDTLSYISKECKEYGEVNLGGLRDKACANTRVTINFNGLQVVKAIKGIFLIRDQQMLIRGNIQREYLDINELSAGKQAIVRAQLPSNPSELNLPIRSGIDPQQVADKLNKYIR